MHMQRMRYTQFVDGATEFCDDLSGGDSSWTLFVNIKTSLIEFKGMYPTRINDFNPNTLTGMQYPGDIIVNSGLLSPLLDHI